MFTGIIEEVGRVRVVSETGLTLTAEKVLEGMELGASISVNGACLTVTRFDRGSFMVDIMPETLKRSNIGLLKTGGSVNLERPLTLAKQLGGHMVQGHIDGTGKVISVVKHGEATIISIEAPPEIMRYIVKRGFVAIDGISLTVISLEKASFAVSIVEHTFKNTTIGSRRVSDVVNIEVDIVAKYVEKLNKKDGAGVTLDFLKEHGFIVV
jgi:riboflavin synthase